MALDDKFRVSNDTIIGGDLYVTSPGASAFFNSISGTQILSGGQDLTDIFVQSANLTGVTDWDNTYATVSALSADWSQGGEAYNTVFDLSADWSQGGQAYTTVFDNSASWSSGGATIPTSANWDSTYTTVFDNSASWITNTLTLDTSGDWDSTHTTVSANSSSWDSTYTTVAANSSSWKRDESGAIKSVIVPYAMGSVGYDNINSISINNSTNCTIVPGDDPGDYIVTFIAPVNTVDYSIISDIDWTDEAFVRVTSKATSGFDFSIYDVNHTYQPPTTGAKNYQANFLVYTAQPTTTVGGGGPRTLQSYTELIGDDTANPIVVTHNLGTKNVIFTLREIATNELLDVPCTALNNNQLQLDFISPPTTGQYQVTIVNTDEAELSIPMSANWESAYTIVATNSAEWSTGGGGGGGGGVFVTNVTCPGITSLNKDDTQVPVQVNGTSTTPVLSASVDDSLVTLTLQWEGSSEYWSGFPTVSGVDIVKIDTTAVGADVRRFEGDITLDLSAYAGDTAYIPYTFGDIDGQIAITVAGVGPEITNVVVTSTPQHQQDHYKDGDSVTFEVTFNTNDVAAVSFNGSGAATGNVTDQAVSVSNNKATITTIIDTAVTSITQLPVKISAKNAFGTAGSEFTSSNIVDCLAGPVIKGVSFGSYPGSQTELKQGDSITATFSFDTTNVNQVNLDGTNDNSLASSDQTVNVSPGGVTEASASITIHTTLASNSVQTFSRSIKARAKGSSHGNWGNFYTSSVTEQLFVNNQAPTFSSPVITYPGTQQAIDNNDTATVNIVVSDQGASVGAAAYVYTDPTGNQLAIPSPTTYDPSGDKSVTMKPVNTFNNSSANFKLTATRPENAKTSSIQTTVVIRGDEPTVSVTVPSARLRSGGTHGTSVQQYTVTVNSDQPLKSFDMEPAAGAGTLSSNSWTASNSNKRWTNSLNVSDNDNKGSFSWTAIQVVDLTDFTKNSVDTGASYTLGGFLNRGVPMSPAQTRTADIGTHVSDTSKLVASETLKGTITFDTSIADGTTIDPDLNTGINVASKFTIVDSSNLNVVDYDGDTIFYLDRDAVSSNASGTSVITITENV